MLWAGQANAQFTTEGTDFWFGFMENQEAGPWPVTIEVYISAREEANITITNTSGSFNESRTISANSSVLIPVPITQMNVTEGVGNRALNVTSDVDVSVYALNKRQFSADAAVILPTKVLGNEYYVMAHRQQFADGTGSERGSEMLVVAVEDNTQIDVTPSVQTDTGLPAGVTQRITLNRGQVYFLQSENADLTGTKVEVVDNGNVCANVAVFGGNIFTNVADNLSCTFGLGNHDHLYEQMFPVSTWGKEFVWVPYETRQGGDFFKVTAAEDGTEVNISGITGVVNLDAGETHTIKALNGVRRISSNNPIQVAQLSRSNLCDGLGIPGDPFMIMLSPLEQRVRQATFDAFNTSVISQYYLTLITETGGNVGVTLDGNDISSEFSAGGGASYASIRIDQGTHTVVAPEGVIAYVYGYGANESFGYSAGVNLENLNLKIVGEDPIIQQDIISKEGCIDQPISFTAQLDETPGQPPIYTDFEWDFGDGNTGTGQDTVHIYDQPGTYEITLVASDGNGGGCGSNSETIRGLVTIVDVTYDDPGIVGAVSVCPDVFGVEYSISGPAGNTYTWEVGGGTIDGDGTGETIAVDWGAANDNAFVRVIPHNYLGCPGDPITLDVKINKRLEPLIPQGSAEVCFTDLSLVNYTTPFTTGSEYEWFIEGGTITSGQNTNEVTVDWGDQGNGRIWYREFNPAITDCEGFSPQLDVIVYGPITATESISDVLCNAGSDGTISLNISGGKPGAYTVRWDNTRTGADISGLAAGTYTATIADELGCEIQQTYTVGEPTPLAIVSSTVMDVRCFQESNGMLMVEIDGGTPDSGGNYSYTWTGAGVNRTTSIPEVDGLPTGNYNLLVTDANNCTIEMDFFVDEPPLLEADLSTLINEPICPNASNGTAYMEAKGGTPDYQFFWSNDPSTDSQEGMNFSQGTYTLRIVDANGCEVTQDIEVTERFPRIYLPNAFSPNGDTENEVFKAVTDCDLNFSMQIFNEWGAITFATTDINEGWDGKVEGKEAPIGKYSYIVFYSGSINGVSFEETLRGTLRLLR